MRETAEYRARSGLTIPFALPCAAPPPSPPAASAKRKTVRRKQRHTAPACSMRSDAGLAGSHRGGRMTVADAGRRAHLPGRLGPGRRRHRRRRRRRRHRHRCLDSSHPLICVSTGSSPPDCLVPSDSQKRKRGSKPAKHHISARRPRRQRPTPMHRIRTCVWIPVLARLPPLGAAGTAPTLHRVPLLCRHRHRLSDRQRLHARTHSMRSAGRREPRPRRGLAAILDSRCKAGVTSKFIEVSLIGTLVLSTYLESVAKVGEFRGSVLNKSCSEQQGMSCDRPRDTEVAERGWLGCAEALRHRLSACQSSERRGPGSPQSVRVPPWSLLVCPESAASGTS